MSLIENAPSILRETDQDRKNQNFLFKTFAQRHGCEYTMVPKDGTHKYCIDGWIHKDNIVIAWVEAKWKESSFKAVNPKKYLEGCRLAQLFMTPFVYLFREPGYMAAITLHNGLNPVAPVKTVISGGTQAGRAPNWDDIEPLVVILGGPTEVLGDNREAG